jgi:hypothetical protein
VVYLSKKEKKKEKKFSQVPKQQTIGVWSQGILGVKYCVHQLFGKEYAILTILERIS